MSSQFQVVKTGQVTKLDRIRAWSELQRAAKDTKTRPFYRAVDKTGRMYAGKLCRYLFPQPGVNLSPIFFALH